MGGKRKCLFFIVAIAMAVGLLPSERCAIAADKDWRTVDVAEAFPGSLADLDNPSATNGGVSGSGRGNKGSFAINTNGEVAIAFVEGWNSSGDIIVGRSKDGKAWDRHKIADVDMRNSWFMQGNGVRVAMTFNYTGPGPQVQVNDAGDICLVYLAGSELATAIWPADEHQLRAADRIVGDLPLMRCGIVKFDRQIGWVRLYQHAGHFFLVTTPESDFTDYVRVYELEDKTWKQLGKPIPAKQGRITWDDVTGDLYLGVESYRDKINGDFPSVFRWDGTNSSWNEIQTPASGMREAFGITSYPGGTCPSLVAHNGDLWAFWWQDGAWLQAAQYHAGHWVSCAKTAMPDQRAGWSNEEGNWKTVDHDSFGQGSGLFHTTLTWLPQCVGLDVFRDKGNGDFVVFVEDGAVGMVIHDGRTYPMQMRRPKTGSASDYSFSLVADKEGDGYADDVHTGTAMEFDTAQAFVADGAVYRLATLQNQATTASDIFVYKYTPRPYRDLGIEFAAQDGPNGELQIKAISPGSLAAQAGLLPGDSVLWVGKELSPIDPAPHQTIRNTIRFVDPGKLPIHIRRSGHESTLTADIPD